MCHNGQINDRYPNNQLHLYTDPGLRMFERGHRDQLPSGSRLLQSLRDLRNSLQASRQGGLRVRHVVLLVVLLPVGRSTLIRAPQTTPAWVMPPSSCLYSKYLHPSTYFINSPLLYIWYTGQLSLYPNS